MKHFIDRHEGGEKVVLVHMTFPNTNSDEELAEFTELALSAGLELAATITGKRYRPDAKYFVGSGKAEEIKLAVQTHQANAIIFDHQLTPAQARNIEKLCCARVVDRTDLILDIFAKRARTYEGRLQVELAQLRHLATRLVRGWTHLERQKGGIGLRGPGETQLEVDRRLIAGRIKNIEAKLKKVEQQREQNRRARHKATLPTISLVGYTNAGKSTLFNALTHAEVYQADQLFATLDPTLRRVNLPRLGEVVFADTVGFIRKLPHELVAAFKATLEETKQAELLLHVIDVNHPQRGDVMQSVDTVLAEIQAEDIPQLLVFNKIDLLEAAEPRIERDKHGKPRAVWLSAAKSQGLNLLREAVIEMLSEEMVYCCVRLSPSDGQLLNQLYERKAIIAQEVVGDDTVYTIRLAKETFVRLFGKIDADDL